MALFSKGISLTQNKEPAFSNKLVKFTNSQSKTFLSDTNHTQDIDQLTPSDIIKISEMADIIDEVDGRSLVSKLRRAEGSAHVIYIDAIDDEPYISSKINPMLQFSDEVVFGIDLCAKVAGTDNVVIKTYRHIGEVKTSIPAKLGKYNIERLAGGYPALPSYSQIKDKGKNEQMVVGIGSLIHLTRAVIYNAIQSTTFVTVAGNSVVNSMNMEVSLGMNFSEILERCGLIQLPSRVVSGGSMTGISIIDTDNTTVTPTTRGILAFHGQLHERAYPCIGCGRCEQRCPSGLNPMSIYNIMNQKVYSQLELYDPQYCIRCGICSYICPSRLDVSGAVIKAKAMLQNVDQKNQEDYDEA